MYCKNCGAEFPSDESVMCVKCGAPKGEGNSYCYNCGKQIDPNAAVCPYCGCSTANLASADAKSKVAAGILGILLGAFGVHNFYLGYTSKAVLQLVLTLVGFVLSCIGIGVFLVLGIEIWGIVEGIMILTGKIDKDGSGRPLKN